MKHSERSEEDILSFEVSDEALEAAGLQCKANPPTQPFAIICIPFGPHTKEK